MASGGVRKPTLLTERTAAGEPLVGRVGGLGPVRVVPVTEQDEIGLWWGLRFDLRLWRGHGKSTGALDFGAHFLNGHVTGWTQKPVVTHLHKPTGQHMLQEAADEFHCPQDHGALAVAFLLLVMKEHLVILHLDDPAVGDGHSKDIGSEVLDGISGYSINWPPTGVT